MLKALKFVRGAVAKKDYVDGLTHFDIRNGRVTGFNGVMALSSPIDIDIEAKPNAVPFIKAITACDEQITMHITKAGRISLRSGVFKAFIECIDIDHPATFVQPEGEAISLGEHFLPAIKSLSPFQAIDASRPWAMGIMLRGQCAYATNNVTLVQYWHGEAIAHDVNIPKQAVAELIRINEAPSYIQTDGRSISFHFEGERWLRCQLLSDNWPEQMEKVFEANGKPVEIPATFFEAIEKLKPFLADDSRIYFTTGGLATSQHEGTGASIEDCHDYRGADGACFHHSQLVSLEGIATHMDFTTYPAPCIFIGERLRGVMMGMVVNSGE